MCRRATIHTMARRRCLKKDDSGTVVVDEKVGLRVVKSDDNNNKNNVGAGEGAMNDDCKSMWKRVDLVTLEGNVNSRNGPFASQLSLEDPTNDRKRPKPTRKPENLIS